MAHRHLVPREVADIRRKTETALAHERVRGQGPPWIRDGARVLYPSDELEAWLASNLVRPDSTGPTGVTGNASVKTVGRRSKTAKPAAGITRKAKSTHPRGA